MSKRVNKQERRAELLKNSTRWERAFAGRLKAAGITFEQQVIIGRYYADFLLPGNLIVELDGAHHLKSPQREHDERRDIYLATHGYKVIRIRNGEAARFDVDRLQPAPVLGRRGYRRRRARPVSRVIYEAEGFYCPRCLAARRLGYNGKAQWRTARGLANHRCVGE